MALSLSELSVSKHFKKHYNLIKLFNSIFSRTTWVSRYQKGKIEARDDSVFGTAVASARPYATICTSLQTDNHTNTPPLSGYRPDALPDAQSTVS